MFSDDKRLEEARALAYDTYQETKQQCFLDIYNWLSQLQNYRITLQILAQKGL